jgi:hypothetical protein
MRIHGLAVLLAAVTAAGTAASETGNFTPDEAVLACLARAGQAAERSLGAPARPAGRFETVRRDDGWRVEAVYEARGDASQRLRVACDIARGRIELVTSAVAN